ncbi:hypothetical protein niasHS_002497 [Heterodera schachtii]|uniref:Uncharacterized protein n=1 Tax=Heterodera schachtii TaxID=97005 RepID=A0ABD2KK60_HETSC
MFRRCPSLRPLRFFVRPPPPFLSLLSLLFLSLLSVNSQSYESSEMGIMEERGGKRMFYQPWSFMKRTPSVAKANDFQKRSEGRQFLLRRPSSADHFGKRSNVVPLMRFGRRPAERAAPLIRFGKRAYIRTDAAPLIRFGRSSEERN